MGQLFTWLLWGCFFLVSIGSLVGAPEGSGSLSKPLGKELACWLAFGLGLIAAGELALTLVLRYYLLLRPARRGSLQVQTTGGMLRFFAVHLLLWFIAQTLPLYGLVLSFLSGQRLFLTLFTVAGLGLLIFYAPRFPPYEHHDPTHG